jgi:hypothetical protein
MPSKDKVDALTVRIDRSFRRLVHLVDRARGEVRLQPTGDAVLRAVNRDSMNHTIAEQDEDGFGGDGVGCE